MVHYKLIYFPGRGTGEVIRQVFALAGQEYEDVRITVEQWPKYKENTPFGQMPVLEEDGKQLGQSYAIARYLSRKFGFAGKTPWEEAQVDALVDQWKDYIKEIWPYIGAMFGQGDQDKDKLKEELFIPAVRKHFPFFVAALNKSGSGFLVGSSVTYVDLPVAEYISKLDEQMPELMNEFPKLRDHVAKVRNIPEIKKWLEIRPSEKGFTNYFKLR